MIRAIKIISALLALVALVGPTVKACGGGTPDSGRDTGGGQNTLVFNSVMSGSDITVSYGGKTATLKIGKWSDTARNATRICVGKGVTADVTIKPRSGKERKTKIKSGKCVDLKKRETATVFAKVGR